MKNKYFIVSIVLIFLLFLFIVSSALFFYLKNKPDSAPDEYTDAVIIIRRSACFGFCPDYKLTIYGDGKVEYEGFNFVETKGKREYKIDEEEVKALIDEFYRIEYFSLKDKYDAQVTDLPSTTTSIEIDGEYKSVYNYYGAPPKLYDLEDKIDETANVDELIGSPTEDFLE